MKFEHKDWVSRSKTFCSYNAELLNPYYSNQCNMAQIQTNFWCTTPNLFISTLYGLSYAVFTFYAHLSHERRYDDWPVAVSFERMLRDIEKILLLPRRIAENSRFAEVAVRFFKYNILSDWFVYTKTIRKLARVVYE